MVAATLPILPVFQGQVVGVAPGEASSKILVKGVRSFMISKKLLLEQLPAPDTRKVVIALQMSLKRPSKVEK